MLGILLLVVFVMMFMHLYRQLSTLQQMQKPAATGKP